jgi:DNA-binding NarL/FixJ family response regulator
MSVKVILADDHVLVRKGIGKLLLDIDGLELAGEAGDGVECLEMVTVQRPHLLLLDISMPRKDGMEVLRELRGQGIAMKILMVTARKERSILTQAMKLGVDGYLTKESAPEDLQNAVYSVLDGNKYIDAEMKSQEEDEENKGILTIREEEILAQLVHGLSNKEIASQLHITERTVKNHMFHIFRKIDVSDRAQAAVYAVKKGMCR